MANLFSFKSFFGGNAPVYIAPILVAGSLLHIFDMTPQKHQFGQLEIIGAFALICYYLWQQMAIVYPYEKLGKKRLEAVISIVIGIFSGFLLFAPLLSWQYITLYLSSDRLRTTKPIAIAMLTLWIGLGIFFYGTFTYTQNKMNAATSAMPQSSFPTPTGTQ